METFIRIMFVSLLVSALPFTALAGDINGDGFDDGVEFIDSNNDGIHDSSLAEPRDDLACNLLIVSQEKPRAYFGLYIFTQMEELHKSLLRETIAGIGGFATSAEANILLFTYNDDYELPVTYMQENSFAMYNWLLEESYSSVTAMAQWEMPNLTMEDYQNYDLIIYWNHYGYDSSSALASAVPFISISGTHAEQMNIGAWNSCHDTQEQVCIINNEHFSTRNYEYGELLFKRSIWVTGLGLLEEGVSLITSDCNLTPVESVNLGDMRSMFR